MCGMTLVFISHDGLNGEDVDSFYARHQRDQYYFGLERAATDIRFNVSNDNPPRHYWLRATTFTRLEQTHSSGINVSSSQ
ncbi:hypothetical protein DSO57_1021129 [Entomophthora muscae]|uniref:Uncharacterized protein n=1 Tax=Entomophthora muscae TaxID=34485 RepID=A0ACC2RIA6_9FUNG|nr:hypothetical protein DSO57_1021129 [Entomophthora muscae]